ncbi:DedA family protein [Dactylosporangium cerinum]|uniref:DedA family protein n=1 Tax=Dactylosporangium cerinum TaxID=1434730 RepID=A0ABV9W2V5_9ACTN
MTRFLDQLLGLHGTAVYAIVGLLVFAEDALLVGFVLPGEAAAILGGVAASRGNVSLGLMCTVVVVAAIVGDSVGYEIGARYGVRLLRLRPLRQRSARIDVARSKLARQGGPAVVGGRFVAYLRAVMPFLAGTSHMPYLRFLTYNAFGGLVWGAGSVLLGYLAGNSYTAVENTFGSVTTVVAALLLILGVTAWTVRRHRRQRRSVRDHEPDPTDS